MAVRREGGQSGSRRRKPRPVGRAIQTAPRPRPVGRAIQRAAPKPKRVGPTIHRVYRARRRVVETPSGGARILSVPEYRRTLRRLKLEDKHRQLFARSMGYGTFGEYAKHRQIKPLDSRVAAQGRLQVMGANIDLSPVGRYLKKNVTGRQTIGGGFARGIAELGKPGAHDVISLPANVVSSGYLTGKAAVAAARGNTKPARQLWRSFKETDPLALTVQGRFKEAEKQAAEHPLAVVLEASGVGKGLSRLGGRAARAGGASMARPSRRVEGTNIVERRPGSRGLVGHGARVAHERRKVRKVARLERRADKAEGRGLLDKSDELHARALHTDPRRVPDQAIEHQVDTVVEGLGQSIRRPGRAQTGKQLRRIVHSVPRRQRPLVSVVAQNIARADRGDLLRYAQELRDAAPKLKGTAKAKANRRLRRQLETALSDPKLDLGRIERAARDYAGATKPLEDEVIANEMLQRGEAERAKLKGYARRNMAAGDDPELGLVDTAGRELPTEAIKAHMRSRGIDPEGTAFVSHAPGRLGDRAFNVSGRRPQGIPTRRRTGAAVLEGTHDINPERLVEQGVQLRGLVDAHRSWQRFVNTFSFRDRSGKVVTRGSKRELERVQRDLEAETGRSYRAIRLNPWGGRQEQLAAVVEHADQEGYIGSHTHPVSDAIEDAVKGNDGQGPWALVPDAAANRLQEHAGVYRTQGPVARTLTQGFRRTVLPLSPSWLAGNTIEGNLRAAISGAGPRSWLTYRRAYNELATGNGSIFQALKKLPEPRHGSPEEQLLHMTPGGHFGGTHETMVRTSAKQFERSRLRPVAQAFHALYRAPGPGTLARAYRHYSDWVFGSFNAALEAQPTRALAGQYIRRELMSAKDRGNMETAIQQAARGVSDTSEQVAMGDFVRRAYGQYDSLSPAMRRTVLNYTPFGLWTWNAVKFLYNVLPRDHPVLTGLLAANHQLSEDWRKQHGLDPWAASALPAFLQGSIPLPGGRHLRVARYTPFGLMGDPTTAVAQNVLPQFSGALMAMRGLDWKGDPLRGSDGQQITDPLELSLIGAREFAFSVVPGPGLAVRVLQKGPRKALNPFEPVAKKKTSSGGGSSWDKPAAKSSGSSWDQPAAKSAGSSWDKR